MRKLIVPFVACLALAACFLTWNGPPKVEAQFAGQNSFSVPFTVIKANKTIPPCISATPTATVPCIPNRNQLGHTITFSYSATVPTAGDFQLDGSNDNTTWVTLAQAVLVNSTPGGGTIYVNGYFTYLRVRVSTGALGTFVCNYTGYGTPLPINPMSNVIGMFAALTTPASLNVANSLNPPFLLTGLDCYNPNGSAAYLQIFKSTAAPSLGTSINTQFGIPAQQSWRYAGPPLMFDNNLWAGASTASAGNAAVATGLACSWQINAAGPFYPLTPVAP